LPIDRRGGGSGERTAGLIGAWFNPALVRSRTGQVRHWSGLSTVRPKLKRAELMWAELMSARNLSSGPGAASA
ncbi:MAG: hypothetical protein ACKO3P_18485, partial [Planctomycetaceae bacterium]